jgi:predicted nucleic acid-binding protein
MFIEKDPLRKRKVEATTSFDKLKEIVTVIPERAIDKLHKKVVGEGNKQLETENIEISESKSDVAAIEMNDKPKLKLLKGAVNGKNEAIPDEHLLEDSIKVVENGDEQDSSFIQNSEMDKQKVLSVIYKYRADNVCPSVKQLMTHTGLNKNSVHNIKKILKTKAF